MLFVLNTIYQKLNLTHLPHAEYILLCIDHKLHNTLREVSGIKLRQFHTHSYLNNCNLPRRLSPLLLTLLCALITHNEARSRCSDCVTVTLTLLIYFALILIFIFSCDFYYFYDKIYYCIVIRKFDHITFSITKTILLRTCSDLYNLMLCLLTITISSKKNRYYVPCSLLHCYSFIFIPSVSLRLQDSLLYPPVFLLTFIYTCFVSNV